MVGRKKRKESMGEGGGEKGDQRGERERASERIELSFLAFSLMHETGILLILEWVTWHRSLLGWVSMFAPTCVE